MKVTVLNTYHPRKAPTDFSPMVVRKFYVELMYRVFKNLAKKTKQKKQKTIELCMTNSENHFKDVIY